MGAKKSSKLQKHDNHFSTGQEIAEKKFLLHATNNQICLKSRTTVLNKICQLMCKEVETKEVFQFRAYEGEPGFIGSSSFYLITVM